MRWTEFTLVTFYLDFNVQTAYAPEKIGDARFLEFASMDLTPNTADIVLECEAHRSL